MHLEELINKSDGRSRNRVINKFAYGLRMGYKIKKQTLGDRLAGIDVMPFYTTPATPNILL